MISTVAAVAMLCGLSGSTCRRHGLAARIPAGGAKERRPCIGTLLIRKR